MYKRQHGDNVFSIIHDTISHIMNNAELLWYRISFFKKYVSSLSNMFGYYMTVVLSKNAGNRAVQETETSRPSAIAATNTTCSAETETRLLSNAAQTKCSLHQVGNVVSKRRYTCTIEFV